MCKGISVLRARINRELMEAYELERRLRERADGAQEELHFMLNDKASELPVIHDGQLVIYEWGNRDNKECRLPKTWWCKTESLEAGKWRWLEPEPVEIPADYGLEKSVWFQITQGIRGIVVRDEEEKPHVYMLTKPASHYFATMTKHDRMPVLIDQEI